MPSTGKCPKCGATVSCAVTKGIGNTNCPKCHVRITFKDGKIVGSH